MSKYIRETIEKEQDT